MTREQLVPHDPTATVAAGGIAPLKAKLTSDERTTPVTARRYAHPAIPGKVVVRLEPDAIAAGTDAEMAAFGFGDAEVSAPLGQVRFRTLGFPAWALVHDPKKAKVALDVTDEMRVAKRLVLAKPGHAKDAFEKIAKTLQRSAPQFLPSFWEECGRVIADHASPAMAAQCFEKARAAERAFKLKSDGEATDAVFVEFALLGALAVKSLTAYAKELVKSAGGKEAYRRFRAIIVKRALGGMPPYSGMSKDLAALVEAAGLDEEVEQDALLAELIDAPGVAKAPAELWTTSRASLVRLGSPIHARLRAIWPDPRSSGGDDARAAFRATWLEILRETGALAALPDEGLGAWVSRLVLYAGKTPAAVALLRELAPRLAKLGQPIAVIVSGRWNAGLALDLAELALELGVPLALPAKDDMFDADAMTCDPVRVAAHPLYGPVLVRSVAYVFGDDKHERMMRGKAGFTAARRAWLVEVLGAIVERGLVQSSVNLDLIDQKTTAATFAPFPELHAQLAAIDLAVPLAHQLAAGCMDELGWPAYEEVFAKLGGEIRVGGAYPIVTLANATVVLAFDGRRVIAEHDLVYKPKDESVKDAVFLDGQFLVLLDVKAGADSGYWSATPKARFETYRHYTPWTGEMPIQWSPPSGGVTLGAKAFRAGDTDPTPASGFAIIAGQMFQKTGTLQAFDPEKGVKVAGAVPAFFTAWPKLELEGCQYLPVDAPGSPLGVREGVWGLRAREIDGDRYEAERLGGGGMICAVAPRALLDLPGATVALSTSKVNNAKFPGGEGFGVAMWTANACIANVNEDDWASRGWGAVHVPPLACWHHLTVRDPAGSLALRGVTPAMVRPILDGAKRDLAAAPDDQARPMPHAEAAVRAALPITDAALVCGVAGIAMRAAEMAAKLAEIVDARHADNASDVALSPQAAKLRKVALALGAGKPTSIADFDVDLRDWLRHGRGSAIAALGPTAQENARALAVDVALALPDTILADDLSRVRIFELETADDYEDDTEWGTVLVVREGANVYLVHTAESFIIEYATDGVFRAPPKPWLVGDSETRDLSPMGSAWLRGFPALAESPPAWSPAIPARLAETTGLTVPEATLLSIALEGVSAWGKDYLGKKVRDQLGLKIAEADAARTAFGKIDREAVYQLMTAAAPDDPAALRDPLAAGGYLERLGAAWKAKYGKRAKIPQELITEAKADLDFGRALDELLPPFAGELEAWFLKPDLEPFVELGSEKGLDGDHAEWLAVLVAWLFFARPVGDPFRNGIPAVVAKLRSIVDDPRTLWQLGRLYVGGQDEKVRARALGLLDMVSGKPVDLGKPNPFRGKDEEDVREARDDGAVVITRGERMLTGGFRTAKLEAARKKIETLARAMADDDDPDPLSAMKIIAYLGSDGFAALAERVTTTPVPAGGYEADPLASAPKLVAKVAKASGISSEAAALYLQTLALAEPRQRDVIAWNGWTTKQYATAAAELVKKKLVIEGKRERAGRSIFVKGAYTKGRGKDLPTEEWKLPFYTQLPRHLPAEPVHLLYARAWKRVEDGDGPK